MPPRDWAGAGTDAEDPGQLVLPGLPSGVVPSIRQQVTMTQRHHLLAQLRVLQRAIDELYAMIYD